MSDQTITFSNRDEIDRKKMAERIIEEISNDNEITPLLIHGRWGSGKTEFAHKMCNLIKDSYSEDFVPIYLSAHEAERVGDPLLPLMAEIYKVIDKGDGDFLKKTSAVITSIGFNAFKTFVPRAPQLIQAVTDIKQELENAEYGNAIIADMIRNYAERDVKAKAYKEALAHAAQNKNVIVFLDELDRCAPTFALQTIEVIKHIFNTEGVHFIVLADREQLLESIRHAYGCAEQAETYLDKFFAYSTKLKEVAEDSMNDPVLHVKEVLDKELNTLAEENASAEWVNQPLWKDITTALAIYSNASLRQTERLIKALKIIIEKHETKAKNRSAAKIMAILAAWVFCFHRNGAEDCIDNRMGCWNAIREGLNQPPNPSSDSNTRKFINELNRAISSVATDNSQAPNFMDRSAFDIYNILTKYERDYGCLPESYVLDFLRTLFLHE